MSCFFCTSVVCFSWPRRFRRNDHGMTSKKLSYLLFLFYKITYVANSIGVRDVVQKCKISASGALDLFSAMHAHFRPCQGHNVRFLERRRRSKLGPVFFFCRSFRASQCTLSRCYHGLSCTFALLGQSNHYSRHKSCRLAVWNFLFSCQVITLQPLS